MKKTEKAGIAVLGVVIAAAVIISMVFYTGFNQLSTTANQSNNTVGYYSQSLHYYNSSSLSFNSSNQMFIANLTKLTLTFPYSHSAFMLPKYLYDNYSKSGHVNISNYILVFQNDTVNDLSFYYSGMVKALEALNVPAYNITNYTFSSYSSFSMNTSVDGREIVLVVVMGPSGKVTIISMHNSNRQFSSEFSYALSEITSSLRFSR